MKNISIKIPICLAATMILSAACTDELADKSTDGTQAIAFAPATETRAAVNGSGELGNFKVWGWYGTPDAINKNVFDGKTIIAPNWTYEGGDQYWIPGNTYNFYGVYPANLPENSVAVTSDGNITITNFDCSATGADAVDLMTASRKGMDGSAPEKVALTFNHELAKVNIIVTSEGDAVDITDAKVYGISHIGTLKNKQWTVGESSTVGNPSFRGSLNIPEADTKPHELFGGSLLLIPTSTEKLANAILSLDYQYKDGTSKSAKINLQQGLIKEWVAASQYKYIITIPKNFVDITVTVEVLPWADKDYTVTW